MVPSASKALEEPPDPSPSKKSAPRVIDFERQTAPDPHQRWTRGGSMRSNVQVLPDKKVRRDKTASSENLVTAVSEPFDPAALLPRPPIAKRPSTDSEDNVADAAAAATALPPRRRSLLAKKPQDSFAAHHPRSSPVAIDLTRGAASPSDLNLLVGARPDDSSDAESGTEDLTSATIVPAASDGSDTSPKDSHNGIGPFSSLRPRSHSMECLGAENPTMPQIRNPSRRVRPSKPCDAPPGSPPKQVSWNLVPDVLNYDKEASGSSHRHYRRHRRHRSDEKIDARKGITNR